MPNLTHSKGKHNNGPEKDIDLADPDIIIIAIERVKARGI